MSYVSRTLCDILEEIRVCHKTRNYSYLLGLVEEAQTAGNRMEAGLDRKREQIYQFKKELGLVKKFEIDP